MLGSEWVTQNSQDRGYSWCFLLFHLSRQGLAKEPRQGSARPLDIIFLCGELVFLQVFCHLDIQLLNLNFQSFNTFEPGAVTCHPQIPRNRDETAQAVSMKQCCQFRSQTICPSVGVCIVPKEASAMIARREQKGK